jgi:cell division septation protein DedD
MKQLNKCGILISLFLCGCFNSTVFTSKKLHTDDEQNLKLGSNAQFVMNPTSNNPENNSISNSTTPPVVLAPTCNAYIQTSSVVPSTNNPINTLPEIITMLSSKSLPDYLTLYCVETNGSSNTFTAQYTKSIDNLILPDNFHSSEFRIDSNTSSPSQPSSCYLEWRNQPLHFCYSPTNTPLVYLIDPALPSPSPTLTPSPNPTLLPSPTPTSTPAPTPTPTSTPWPSSSPSNPPYSSPNPTSSPSSSPPPLPTVNAWICPSYLSVIWCNSNTNDSYGHALYNYGSASLDFCGPNGWPATCRNDIPSSPSLTPQSVAPALGFMPHFNGGGGNSNSGSGTCCGTVEGLACRVNGDPGLYTCTNNSCNCDTMTGI